VVQEYRHDRVEPDLPVARRLGTRDFTDDDDDSEGVVDPITTRQLAPR
jgi:hypothetical protein